MARVALHGRARRGQDARRGRMGARQGAGLRRWVRLRAPHRARRRDDRRRAPRDDRGRVGSLERARVRASARASSRRRDSSCGRRARSRRFSRPRTPTACAGRSSMPPGATRSPSGGIRKKHGTCCSSRCGSGAHRRWWRRRRRGRSRLLKKLLADAGTVVTRAATADNAENLAPSFVDEMTRRYCGHGAGAAGIAGRARRRHLGRAVAARLDRRAPSCGTRRSCRRSWWRSIRR